MHHLTRLQNLPSTGTSSDIFLTVNPREPPTTPLFTWDADHPCMDIESYRAQQEEHLHQGKEGIFHGTL